MSKNITQKIRGLLTPEDLKVFESAVDGMINDKVQEKLSQLIELKEQELKAKYEALAEKYVNKVSDERKAELDEENVKWKAGILEGYDDKLALLEQRIVTKLDSYLDHVISEQISDEMLEKIAINETLAPVVEGIREVFSENHLKVDSKAQKAINSLKAELAESRDELSEAIDKRMVLEGKLEESAVYLLISEKTSGLKRSDKQKVVEMFKGKEFDEVEGTIDNYITLIKESDKPTKKKVVKKSVKEKVQAVNEGAVVDVEKEPVKAVEEEPIAEETTISDIANKYLF